MNAIEREVIFQPYPKGSAGGSRGEDPGFNSESLSLNPTGPMAFYFPLFPIRPLIPCSPRRWRSSFSYHFIPGPVLKPTLHILVVPLRQLC